MVRLEGFVSSCNKEVHGSGAGWLLGWYTEVEQIAEAMNAMQRQIAELASQLAEERHRGASLDRVAQVLDRWTTQQAQQPVARLVDTRGIGRPSNFGSGEEKSLEKSFPVWQRKMQN